MLLDQRDPVTLTDAVVGAGDLGFGLPSSPRSTRWCCARAFIRSISLFEASEINATSLDRIFGGQLAQFSTACSRA